MARSFNGSTQYLEASISQITLPASIALWIYPFSSAPLLDNSIVFAGQFGDDTAWMRLLIEGNTVGDRGKLRFVTRNGTTARAQTANTVTANVWQHACGVGAATNDRRIYLNGTNDKGTNSETRATPTTNILNLGHRGSIQQDWYNGYMAHVCLWNVALTDGEVDALAAGVHPQRIRPDDIVFYWPLNGQSPELDVRGNANLTAYGSPPVIEEQAPMWGNHIVAPP